jgi:hypothetical protein
VYSRKQQSQCEIFSIFEVKMRRKVVPIENYLLLHLAKHGGSATLTRIRLDFGGRLTCAHLAQARQKLGDLVVLEKTGTKPTDRYKRRGRPTTSLSLSLRGWAAVQFLLPGWQPRMLAVPVLKAWLAELQAERNPWALQIAQDGADAWSWRNHEKIRKEREREKERKREREKPEPKYPSSSRNRSEEELEARREWARSKNPNWKQDGDDTEAQPPAPKPTIPTPARPAPARTFADELWAAQGRQLAGFGEPVRGFDNSPQSEPRASTGETRSQVYARAGDYRDSQMGLMFNGEVFGNDWKGWAAASKK